MIACLLPARNAEPDLGDWLASAKSFADVIVALDDGSMDRSAEILRADPTVAMVLVNEPRPGFSGWDDGANRRRLLNAAGELEPDWIVFLDSDERIDVEDGRALRTFLKTDAIAPCAYGLTMFDEVGSAVVEIPPRTVYRVFAWRAGLALPNERFHFNPVPVTIPETAYVPTTIRARHLAGPARRAARSDKYREADPAGQWGRDRPRPEQAPETTSWGPRESNLPVLFPRGVLPGALASGGSHSIRPKLACLLPVRNGQDEIPGYLDSVRRFADGVLALDDGSTDSTAALLGSADGVELIHSEPPRSSYAGWDDRRNRQTLLDAARQRGFDWVLYLDADERISADDAPAIRSLVDSAADPDHAYGFRVFGMTGGDSFDRAGLWVYRLFATTAGGNLPDRRLHLVPVPTSLEPEDWIRTTVRIQHFGGSTPERRLARAAKYDEADPDRKWQASYANLTRSAGPARSWRTRPEGLPILAEGREARGASLDLTTIGWDAPALSAIVIARDNADTIEATVRSIVSQECDAPFEVIVAASGTDGTLRVVRELFPDVVAVEVPEPGLPGMARNAGLAVARGEFVSFPGSHVELPEGSLQARINAHELGYAMVTGTLLNGTPTRSGWASYFMDASGSLPDRPSGELAGPPARCSYVRDAIDEVGGFPEDVRAGEDTAVNNALWDRGFTAYRSQDLRLNHRSRCRTPARLCRHHYARGRALARLLEQDVSAGSRSLRAKFVLVAGYPLKRIRGIRSRVRLWGGSLRPEYRRSRPLIVLGVLAATAGLGSGLLKPRGKPRGRDS